MEEQLTRQVEETKRVELALRQRDKDERRAQAALREEVQEREEEILRQVEETKRVEQALRLREKEVYSLKVRPAPSPLRPPRLDDMLTSGPMLVETNRRRTSSFRRPIRVSRKRRKMPSPPRLCSRRRNPRHVHSTFFSPSVVPFNNQPNA